LSFAGNCGKHYRKLRTIRREGHWNNCIATEKYSRLRKKLLRWREKVIRATKSADCAEIGTFRKIERFTHFGEISESPDKIIFYCQHNITRKIFP
jgi:hypothetical protein